MLLYRQKRLGDWAEVMERVAADCRSHGLKKSRQRRGGVA